MGGVGQFKRNGRRLLLLPFSGKTMVVEDLLSFLQRPAGHRIILGMGRHRGKHHRNISGIRPIFHPFSAQGGQGQVQAGQVLLVQTGDQNHAIGQIAHHQVLQFRKTGAAVDEHIIKTTLLAIRTARQTKPLQIPLEQN